MKRARVDAPLAGEFSSELFPKWSVEACQQDARTVRSHLACFLHGQHGLPGARPSTDGTPPAVAEEPQDLDAPAMNVIVRLDDEAVSLLVDRIGEVVDLDDDAFEPPPDTLSGPTRELVVGTFKLDGRLMLALDVNQAVDTYRATT